MKIRFMITIGGTLFFFYKKWKSVYFPQIGNSIELENFLTDKELEYAKASLFTVFPLLGGIKKMTLKDILTNTSNLKIIDICWTGFDSVDIELARTGINGKNVQTIQTGKDDITDYDSF